MTITRTDSRRWTGPNLLSGQPGAVIDAACTGDADAGAFLERWHLEARRMLDALDWQAEALHARPVRGGMILALTAPVDALYAATEVNEWAFDAALHSADGRSPPAGFEGDVVRLMKTMDAERNPRLMSLRRAAMEHRVAFLSDDDHVSVGLGRGSHTWPTGEVPDPGEVPWADVHDVPVALVTGTNGKTTTVRMLASIARAAGHRVGLTSTDGIVIDGALIEPGDYSGPGGGRRLLRERGLEVAILEAARGGMLRRGLAVLRADTAAVTNVAEDHLGEFGVHDAAALAEVKLIVARAIDRPGALALNADEALLRERGEDGLDPAPAWFSTESGAHGPARLLQDRAPRSGRLEGGALIVRDREGPDWAVPVAEIPATFAGAARHNVANALVAMVMARALGLSEEAVFAGLRGFDPSAAGNPGRGNVRTIGGVRLILDFAHNPHGLTAMVDFALALPARRRHVVLGQAGDRDDDSIRALARAAWRMAPARVVIKEMISYLRGRAEGEVPLVIEAELRAIGATDDRLTHARGELEAAREAMRGAAPGDLVLLLVHSDRGSVEGWLDRLERSDWRAGQPLEVHL